ncbi:MAG: co-chaperone GroES family protein [Candidatus Eiseniibacteriota bacterium]|jgi:co-chaperonin GroES (HSP10)
MIHTMGELILIGDRVLIEPQDGEQQTRAGLYLPVTVTERDRVRTGRVVKVGPGHLMPNPEFAEGEPWTGRREAVRFLPLQARPGDFAFFMRQDAIEITFEDRSFLIVQHGAILALVRATTDDIMDDIASLLRGDAPAGNEVEGEGEESADS